MIFGTVQVQDKETKIVNMKPGDKVICINDRKDPNITYSAFPSWIKEGETYHIRRVESNIGQGKRLLLDEVSNPSVYVDSVMGNIEPGFVSTRFANYEDFVLGNVESKEMEKVILN